MSKKTGVKFTKRHGVYNPGDVAGFDDEKAKYLVSIKVAELLKVAKPAKAQGDQTGGGAAQS